MISFEDRACFRCSCLSRVCATGACGLRDVSSGERLLLATFSSGSSELDGRETEEAVGDAAAGACGLIVGKLML